MVQLISLDKLPSHLGGSSQSYNSVVDIPFSISKDKNIKQDKNNETVNICRGGESSCENGKKISNILKVYIDTILLVNISVNIKKSLRGDSQNIKANNKRDKK